MKSRIVWTVIFGLSVAATAVQADLFVYPQKGQSGEQTDKDKFECYNWAKENSGFDPMARPTATTAPPKVKEQRGGALKGGAVGAIAGKVLGSSSKTTKRSAALGAVAGSVRQSSGNREQQQKKADWEQREGSNYEAQRNGYNRAYSACLEGRGYSVK